VSKPATVEEVDAIAEEIGEDNGSEFPGPSFLYTL